MTITDCCPSNKTDGATDSDGAADTAAGEEKASCLGFGLDKKSDDSQQNIQTFNCVRPGLKIR